MPGKVTEPATDYREVDRWAGGVGWMPHPTEIMRRTGHALATDAGVWVVDPLDAPGLDDLLAEFGEVTGVVVLSNFHRRDAAAVADRHDVPVRVPASMSDVADELEGAVERVAVGDHLGDYELIEVASGTLLGAQWDEFGLYDGETLVVGECLGRAPYMRVGDERLGLMLLRRWNPPRESLGDLSPERILSGHGAGVDDDAAAALDDVLTNARRRFPRALLANGIDQVRTVLAAART